MRRTLSRRMEMASSENAPPTVRAVANKGITMPVQPRTSMQGDPRTAEPWKVVVGSSFRFEAIEFMDEISKKDAAHIASNLDAICAEIGLEGEAKKRLGKRITLRFEDDQFAPSGTSGLQNGKIVVTLAGTSKTDLNILAHEVFHGIDTRAFQEFAASKNIPGVTDKGHAILLSEVADKFPENAACRLVVEKLGTDSAIRARESEHRKDQYLSLGKNPIVVRILTKLEKSRGVSYFESKVEVLARAFAWKVSGKNQCELRPGNTPIFVNHDTEERLREAYVAADCVAKVACDMAPSSSLNAGISKKQGSHYSKDRVSVLPQLENSAGASLVLWRTATQALRDAGGDAGAVDWRQVEEATIARSLGEY